MDATQSMLLRMPGGDASPLMEPVTFTNQLCRDSEPHPQLRYRVPSNNALRPKPELDYWPKRDHHVRLTTTIPCSHTSLPPDPLGISANLLVQEPGAYPFLRADAVPRHILSTQPPTLFTTRRQHRHRLRMGQ